MPPLNGHSLRRSSRVPITVPVRVTSLEPNPQFSEVCETLVVSAHGCSLRSPMKLEAGMPLRLYSKEGRQATAQVVICQPMGSDQQGWKLGAKLDQPDNFWGLTACPEDWLRLLEMPAPAAPPAQRKLPGGNSGAPQPPAQVAASLKPVFDKIEKQLSDEHLKVVLAELVRPLQTEMSDLREKLARGDARRSRFEVSLGHIPPELEEKLWIRLRQDLGTRVLQQTREQSAEVLAGAKATIEQKIGDAQAEFRHRLVGELQVVEQRAQALSQDLAGAVRQHVRTGTEKLQQQAADAGTRLDGQGEELLRVLEQRLVDKHNAHRQEMEQVQAAVAAQASQFQAQVADLGPRIKKQDESVRRLELELDEHLERIAAEIVSDARTQLEGAANAALKELQIRGANEFAGQLDEACGQLRTIQNRIENSFSGSLSAQIAEALQSFGQDIEKLAQQSVERWRMALARDLNSVAKTLGEQFRLEAGSGSGEKPNPPAV